MATAIIPKSEIRMNHNIMVGYGEVPACEIDGRFGWGLPNGQFTEQEEEARDWATRLDSVIRANLRDPKQLLH